MAAAAPVDRAALSQSRTGSPAAGTGEDAADLLPAAVVQPVGPAGRRRDLRQRVDASLRTRRAGRGGGAGREYDSTLPPPAGEAWADQSHLRCGLAGRAPAVAA